MGAGTRMVTSSPSWLIDYAFSARGLAGGSHLSKRGAARIIACGLHSRACHNGCNSRPCDSGRPGALLDVPCHSSPWTYRRSLRGTVSPPLWSWASTMAPTNRASTAPRSPIISKPSILATSFVNVLESHSWPAAGAAGPSAP
jgi:hypothetical protein